MSEVNMGDYNRGGYLAFMFCMVVTMAFFIYLAFIHPGVDLQEIQLPENAKKEAPVAQPAAPTDSKTAPASPAQ